VTNDHNAYLNTAQMTPTNASDIVLTDFTYATGSLGNYYQASTNLINKGSTTANLTGLYHYTTQTNQVEETNSVVDIGYHYVALDQYGNIRDANDNNIPIGGNSNILEFKPYQFKRRFRRRRPFHCIRL